MDILLWHYDLRILPKLIFFKKSKNRPVVCVPDRYHLRFAVLYSLVAFFAFMLMPFMYFYFEEKDEEVTTRQVSYIVIKY